MPDVRRWPGTCPGVGRRGSRLVLPSDGLLGSEQGAAVDPLQGPAQDRLKVHLSTILREPAPSRG